MLALSDLDRPNLSADPALAGYARKFVQTLPHPGLDETVQQTRRAIYHLVPLGRASLPEVARSLGLDQRRIAAASGGGARGVCRPFGPGPP